MLLLKKSKDKKYNPLSQPERILLTKETTSFGRSADLVDVVVDSSLSPRMISRVHAKISQKGEDFFIESDSLNGVLVNSVKRKKCQLQNGDIIVFGGAGAKTVEGSTVENNSQSELVYVFQTQQKCYSSDHKTESRRTEVLSKEGFSEVNNERKTLNTKRCTSNLSRRGELCELESWNTRSKRVVESTIKESEKQTCEGLKNVETDDQLRPLSCSDGQPMAKETTENLSKFPCDTQKRIDYYHKETTKGSHCKVDSDNNQPFHSGVIFENSPGEGTSDGLVKKNKTATLIDSDDDIYGTQPYKDAVSSQDDKESVVCKRKKKRSRMHFDSDDDSSASPDRKLLKKDSTSKIGEANNRQDLQSEIHQNKVFLNDLNEELLCCICRELLVLTHALPCSHTFCYMCIRNWLREAHDCPSCRSKAAFNTLVPVKVLDNMVDKVAIRVLNSDELEERNIKIQELQARINGRMEENSELRAEYGGVNDDKEYCEKCNLPISNRLLRWVVSFPKTSTTACYHYKCFKPPTSIAINQIKIVNDISKRDLIKIKTVVKKQFSF